MLLLLPLGRRWTWYSFVANEHLTLYEGLRQQPSGWRRKRQRSLPRVQCSRRRNGCRSVSMDRRCKKCAHGERNTVPGKQIHRLPPIPLILLIWEKTKHPVYRNQKYQLHCCGSPEVSELCPRHPQPWPKIEILERAVILTLAALFSTGLRDGSKMEFWTGIFGRCKVPVKQTARRGSKLLSQPSHWLSAWHATKSPSDSVSLSRKIQMSQLHGLLLCSTFWGCEIS